jgi:hypothetical protein
MFNAAGGGNTPHVSEGYYNVQLCGGIGTYIFWIASESRRYFHRKQKSEKPLDHQPPLIKRSKMGVTLVILMHEETKN